MKKNIGKKDRIIRLILGIIFFLIGIFMKDILGAVGIILGLILLITVFTGYCSLYKPFGINTNESGDEK
ncbi:MAG: DUF2892 domain-containing protein [Thermodesulfobacteriota bacterium]|nr:DUF2892 domain-containing protein [Thermodesulfobacteriota bacterium]